MMRARSPEGWLQLALRAESVERRRECALEGLAAPHLDDDVKCLLLRQLYLAALESGDLESALDRAEEMIELGELADVARQDAARVCIALGHPEVAAGHLRIAARICPASRRAFHDWSLAVVLRNAGNTRGALSPLSRAARWSTTQRPLYEAQLALFQSELGEPTENLADLREQLQDAPCAEGYGQFVLGELAYELGDSAAAVRHLSTFLEGAEQRPVKALTLSVEIRRARELLERFD